MSTVELRAPEGKFRVVCVDTFSDEDWIGGDYDTLEIAKEMADLAGGSMLKVHVYNDLKEHLYEAGTF